MSSHVIGKSNSNKVITKTVTTDEKIKLKKCLGKINILSEGYNNMELD